jgi:hypothetical protein
LTPTLSTERLLGRKKSRLVSLEAVDKIKLIAPGSVGQETQHPHTPAEAQEIASAKIFLLPVELNGEERTQLTQIRAILPGNAAPGMHDTDARMCSRRQDMVAIS